MSLRNTLKYILITALFFAINSCKKKSDNDQFENGPIRFVFQNVAVVDEVQIVKNASTHVVNGNLQAEQSPKATTQTKNELGFSTDVFATQNTITSDENASNERDNYSSEPINKNAGNTRMSTGFTYRILLYTASDNKFFKTILAKSGTAFEIEVAKGTKYKWYAYSYNDDQDIPEPANLENPNIEMSVDKSFLYASGEIDVTRTPPGQKNIYPINPIFTHKVTKVHVKIDGTSLAQVANIQSIKVSFEKNNYFKKGVFSIKNNEIKNLEVVEKSIVFDQVSPNNIWEKSFYTADPSSAKEYQINVEDLTVDFFLANVNGSIINVATHNPNKKPKFNFKYNNPAAGEQLTGIANLNYVLQSRRILHLSIRNRFAYAFESGSPWKMINDLRNFGNLPNSLVKMQPYAPGQGVWKGGSKENNLANTLRGASNRSETIAFLKELDDPNNRPDIIISGHDSYDFSNESIDALVKFVNDGGVFILMNERTNESVTKLVNRLFDIPDSRQENRIQLHALWGAGSMYPLVTNVDKNDRVLVGPFGDARGKLWGEDASTTVGVSGLPANNVEIYSLGQAINRRSDPPSANYVSMFKHKTKSFFYLGDGGLISWSSDNFEDNDRSPFRLDPETSRPVPRLYGITGQGYASKSQPAYNGVIAGNLMLWAGAIAEFNGINPWKYKQ